MARKKTSAKQRKSGKENFRHLEVLKPEEGFQDSKEVLDSLIECLKQNDLESFEDILVAYLRTASKTSLQRKTKLGRQTLYDLTQKKRDFNPTLRTLGAIFQALAA